MSEKKSFLDNTIMDFAEQLGSGAPTPGGGAAAALESALGAALIMMVANHTIGKESYAEYEELNTRVLREAEEIRSRLLEGVDRDAECFGKVSSAFGLPRRFGDIEIDKVSAVIEELRGDGAVIDSIDEEGLSEAVIEQIETALKAKRSAVIGEASVEAAEAPLAVMEDSVKALVLAKSILGRSNANLESDIMVAALSLSAGLASAAYNVDANLPAIRRKDPDLADRLSLRAAELRKESAELTETITKNRK